MTSLKTQLLNIYNLSLLKRAKNLFRGCLKENIFFLHIPKCAGSSIKNSIKDQYLSFNFSKDNKLVSLDSASTINIINIINQNIYPHTTDDDYPILKLRENLLLYFMSGMNNIFIDGHFTFSDTAYRNFHNNYAFITLIREPVSRWISSYFYNTYKENNRFKIDEDITKYLESDFCKSQGYEFVKFIGGLDKAGDYTSKQAIDRAKKNLHKFDILGFLEYPEVFLNRFEVQFGVRLKLEKINPSPKSNAFRKSIVTKDIEEQIKRICEPDLEIYHYALDNFM